ncbi:MAG: DMT family transporter [Candidatus Daviesbacteria bacterium]|nr:DMT family transporter [Candidatus Daviesbacteria bacterium]
MDIIFAWIACIASGITPLIIKASSKSLVKSPWLFNLLWLVFGIPLVIILAVFNGGGLPSDWQSVILLSLSSAFFYIFYTVSLYKLDVTTIGPLFSLRTVFAVILGIVILRERIEVFGIVLIATIVLLSPFAAYDEHLKIKAFFQKYVFLAVIGMLSLAFMGYFTNISVAKNGYATTLLWQDFLTLLMLLPTIKLIKKDQEEKFTLKKLYPFMLLGLTGFTYTVTATLAYAHNLALSSVIVSLPLSMVFAYLLSRKYARFLEKHPPRVYAIRFFAASIMVSCAIWLSLL